MSAAHSLCDECDGTGWILYRSETVDGELEEAYCLCSNRCAPRYCMVRSNDRHLCSRPGTVYYALRYFCKEHIEVIRADEDANHPHQAMYYLR
jgi:hypothetical protein